MQRVGPPPGGHLLSADHFEMARRDFRELVSANNLTERETSKQKVWRQIVGETKITKDRDREKKIERPFEGKRWISAGSGQKREATEQRWT